MHLDFAFFDRVLIVADASQIIASRVIRGRCTACGWTA